MSCGIEATRELNGLLRFSNDSPEIEQTLLSPDIEELAKNT